MLHRFKTTTIAIASLLATLLIVDIAAAQIKPRNPIERRQRPNAGFFESSSPSRSYSSVRSVVRQPQSYASNRVVVPQSYAAVESYAAPQTYASPQGQIVSRYAVPRTSVAAPVVSNYVAPLNPVATATTTAAPVNTPATPIAASGSPVAVGQAAGFVNPPVTYVPCRPVSVIR